ncbi:MAG: TetR/AcrR family transcriptional regulator [Dermatophilaceae bacterium]
MSGRRDAAKAERRARILQAARALLRTQDPTEVGMADVAAAAGVALSTVYELVGTRERLQVALVDAVLDELDQGLSELAEPDPLVRARVAVKLSVSLFVRDEELFRRIWPSPTQFGDRLHGLRSRPVRLQVDALTEARHARRIARHANPDVLGLQIYATFVGALQLWLSGGLDDPGFETTAVRGLDVVLVAFGTPVTRTEAARRLDGARPPRRGRPT